VARDKGCENDLIKVGFANPLVGHIDLKKIEIDQELGLLFQNTHNHEAFLILFNLLNIFLFQRSVLWPRLRLIK
jgi:hypothetical protein